MAGADQQFVARAYAERSSMLTTEFTEFTVDGQPSYLTDWLLLAGELTGLCQQFSAAPAPLTIRLRLRPNF